MSGLHRWQEEKLFLDVRGEVQEINDLADPRRTDVPQPRELRLLKTRVEV